MTRACQHARGRKAVATLLPRTLVSVATALISLGIGMSSQTRPASSLSFVQPPRHGSSGAPRSSEIRLCYGKRAQGSEEIELQNVQQGQEQQRDRWPAMQETMKQVERPVLSLIDAAGFVFYFLLFKVLWENYQAAHALHLPTEGLAGKAL